VRGGEGKCAQRCLDAKGKELRTRSAESAVGAVVPRNILQPVLFYPVGVSKEIFGVQK
jgi:hypothetical protein